MKKSKAPKDRAGEGREPRAWRQKAPAPDTAERGSGLLASGPLPDWWVAGLAACDAKTRAQAMLLRSRFLSPALDPHGALGLSLTPLEALTEAVRRGLPPPPEALTQIAGAFEKYVAAAGAMELETANFGQRQPRAGNWAARHAARRCALKANIKIANAYVEGENKIRAAERIAPGIKKQRKGRVIEATPPALVKQYARTGGKEVAKFVSEMRKHWPKDK